MYKQFELDYKLVSPQSTQVYHTGDIVWVRTIKAGMVTYSQSKILDVLAKVVRIEFEGIVRPFYCRKNRNNIAEREAVYRNSPAAHLLMLRDQDALAEISALRAEHSQRVQTLSAPDNGEIKPAFGTAVVKPAEAQILPELMATNTEMSAALAVIETSYTIAPAE